MAVEISRRCPPSPGAFSVGAVIVDHCAGPAADAPVRVLATGYSRELDPHDHAEEVALRRLARRGRDGLPVPVGPLTLYSSLEPCSARASRPRTCTELIIEGGIRRVVFAWREPVLFVDCEGVEIMRRAGLDVVEVPALAAAVRAVNAHLLA